MDVVMAPPMEHPNLWENFIKLFEPTDNKCWEAKSEWIETAFWKMAVLQLILHVRIQGEDMG